MHIEGGRHWLAILYKIPMNWMHLKLVWAFATQQFVLGWRPEYCVFSPLFKNYSTQHRAVVLDRELVQLFKHYVHYCVSENNLFWLHRQTGGLCLSVFLLFSWCFLRNIMCWWSCEYLHMFQSRLKLCRLGLVARVALSLGMSGARYIIQATQTTPSHTKVSCVYTVGHTHVSY